MKPNVVFFGESISEEVKNRAFKAVEASSQLLILGTSLATYSAFRSVSFSSYPLLPLLSLTFFPLLVVGSHRMIKQALSSVPPKPILLISTGPSRADGLEGLEKIEMEAGPVLKLALEGLARGVVEKGDPVLKRLRESGVVKRPMGDD